MLAPVCGIFKERRDGFGPVNAQDGGSASLALLEDYNKGDLINRCRLRAAAPVKGRDVLLLMLDPGHGGEDPGAIGKIQNAKRRAVPPDSPPPARADRWCSKAT